MECPHEDSITYYDVIANWQQDGEQYHVVEIECESCDSRGGQIEVLDKEDDEYVFVTEYWK